MSDRPLPPWDAISWFQPPVVRFFSCTGADDVPVKADPNRVYLAFAVGTGTTTVQVWPARISSTTQGFTVSQNDPREFLQAWHGPLVNIEWHVFSTPGAVLSICEVSLRSWPQQDEGTP